MPLTADVPNHRTSGDRPPASARSRTRTLLRGLAGLVLGLAAGTGLLVWLSNEAVGHEEAARADRLAVVRTRMVADVAGRAGRFDDTTRAAVARVAAADPAIASVRVVRLDGAVLEASTVAGDTGDGAPPRRLEPSEKWLFDLGQELQAARVTNLEEGTARKDEILLAREPDGRRRVAAPLDIDGNVAGLVHVEVVAQPTPRGGVPATAVALALVVPALLLYPLAGVVGDRRGAVALLCAMQLVGALGVFSWYMTRTLVDARRQTTHAVVDLTRDQVAVARTSVPADERPFDVSEWDVDRFRRPLRLVGPDGRPDPATMEREAAEIRLWALRRAIPIAALALVVLLTVTLGLAPRTGATSSARSR